jgi:hypothetical protein
MTEWAGHKGFRQDFVRRRQQEHAEKNRRPNGVPRGCVSQAKCSEQG